ncbi:hypothetical protein BKA70DRAFT_1459254 [Coprinopsis sp. MPI-PUGE-AT-0042]|nr:hypothetical protein BKA70DRAFT_1459254 [Coprinopsis sp. MPI-PUGE-AT-0042]
MGNLLSQLLTGFAVSRENVEEHGDDQEEEACTPMDSEDSGAFDRSVQNIQITGESFHTAGRDINNTTINYNGKDFGIPTAQEFRSVLDWLSNINFRGFHQSNLQIRVAGTGQKYLNADTFKKWLEDGGILWGTGMPGSGKTILASIIIEYLESLATEAPDGEIGVVFAFCRYTESQGLLVRDVLAALVRQALERRPELVQLVYPLYERHSTELTTPGQQELVDVLMDVAKHFKHFYLGVDGLDEAADAAQFDLVTILSTLNVKFLITSRPLQGLESLVPTAKHFNIVAESHDIDLLLSRHLEKNPHFRQLIDSHGTKLNKEYLAKAISAKSEGMFLHAKLQIEALEECLTAKQLSDHLAQFPLKINEMYAQTMERVKKQSANRVSLAMAILTWLVHGRSPLSVEQMKHALATNQETYDAECIVSQHQLLLSVCCGLVTLAPSQVLRLVHVTARDALRPFVKEHKPDPHAFLTSICISHISTLHRGNGQISLPPDSILELNSTLLFARTFKETTPFLLYAIRNWMWHHSNCRKPSPELGGDVLKFVAKCQPLPVYFRNKAAFDPSTHLNRSENDDWYQPFSLEQVSAMAKIPLPIPVTAIHPGLASQSDKTPSRAIAGPSPIVLAAMEGNTAFIRQVVLDPRWSEYESRPELLLLAARNGREEVVKQLLEPGGIDVNAKPPPSKETALMVAVRQKHVRVIRLLLSHRRLDFHAKSAQGWTALTIAIACGHQDIQRLLVQSCTSQPVDFDDDRLRATVAAAKMRCFDLAMRLLEDDTVFPTVTQVPSRTGRANTNVGQETPLIRASRYRNIIMVRHILSKPGARVNDKDPKGQTALIHAVIGGFDVIVGDLLGHPEIDANAVCNAGRTALMYAVTQRQPERHIIQALVTHPGIQIDAVCPQGCTAIEYAELEKHTVVANFLRRFRDRTG